MNPRLAAILVLLLCFLPQGVRAQFADILSTPELAEPDLDLLPDEDAPAPPEPLFEKQKRLLYLLARLKRSGPVRPLAARVLAREPSDKESLLALTSMELERKNAPGVLHYARRFLKFYPKDDQGWYFIAATASLTGHHAAAKGVLEKMRAELFAGRDFPYKVDLASSARLSGDWRTALSVYKELLEDRQTSRPLREEARRIIDEIYREQLPRVNLSADYQHLFATGDILRTDAAWESPLTNRIRLFVNMHRDDLHQKLNGLLFAMPLNDHAVYLGFLSIIPGMAVFLLKFETEFSNHYTGFFMDLVAKAPLAVLERRRVGMVESLRTEAIGLAKYQGAFTLVLLVLADRIMPVLGLGALQTGVFQVVLLGSFLLLLFLSFLTVLFYLDERRSALLCCGVFAATNILVTAASIRLGEQWYGVGFVAASMAGLILSSWLAQKHLETLIFDTFTRQPMYPDAP